MNDPRKQSLLLVLITVAALAPFLNKAFHIDDPLFIWTAQQIVKHPLDPYGFQLNWATFAQPAFEQIQNPPLCSYYIAAVGSVFGFGEISLHLAFLVWATLSILGTFILARRFCEKPFQAALFTLFTPAFLVSATNVMCDVMLLGLWIWAVEFWLRGLEPDEWKMSILSAFLVALASLTKYFGIALVPLLALYTIWRNWRQCSRVLFLLLPVAVIVGFDFWTKAKYGRGLFSDATRYAHQVGARSTSSFFIGLAFLGGSFLLPLFYLPLKSWRFLLITIAISAATFASSWFLLRFNPDWQLGPNESLVRFQAALFAAIGASILGWVVVDLTQSRSAKRVLIASWLVGTFVFAAVLNWSITARTFLPLAPAVAILFVRRTRNAWPLLPAIIVSIAVAFADFRSANGARMSAKVFQKQFRDQRITVWFQSHWGFQYYMQQWGAKPFDARDVKVESGDVMIVPANNIAVTAIPPEQIFPPEDQTFAALPWISTVGLTTGASFYSSIRGPIPWAIDPVPPEKYYVARFR